MDYSKWIILIFEHYLWRSSSASKGQALSFSHSCLSHVVLLSCRYELKPIQWKISSKKDLCGLFLVLLPFIFASIMMVKNSLCLSRCPSSLIFLFVIAFRIVLLSLTSSDIASLDLSSIQLVPVILRHIHISIASSLFSSYIPIVHVSEPHNRILHSMYVCINFFHDI